MALGVIGFGSRDSHALSERAPTPFKHGLDVLVAKPAHPGALGVKEGPPLACTPQRGLVHHSARVVAAKSIYEVPLYPLVIQPSHPVRSRHVDGSTFVSLLIGVVSV